MANFAFELVSPERLLFAGEVEQVIVPGMEGDFAVMHGHMPFLAALRPGLLTVIGGNEMRLFVRGGFADVSPSGLAVLAEQAIPVEEMGPGGLDQEIRLAQQDLERADTEDSRRVAAERLAKMNELKSQLFG